ncbi:lipopolysaccharide heptosyltransferase II [Thermodesulforhabdus norvegica]|uniref:lipopolysaccharide heptosyltransferase II n=1 Tax=Thermodesulforhabdus norvegica TaxID=39841 RepID=A0A1I4TZR5_9BACT|nr:lipopolysaccharide heptosyltransferase II [Thermodesulforhabdus norvegica]SFM82099.1 heptosyltransferase-2 [Thermodesulforhabdus norvegica]
MKGLFVRLPNWLGDAVMASPALELILRAFPHRFCCIVGPSGICDLFAGFSGVGRVDLRNRGLSRVIEAACAYRQMKARSVVLFTNSFASALESFLGGAEERLGLTTDGRRILLSNPIPAPPKNFLHEQDVFTLIAGEAVVRWEGSLRALGETRPYPGLDVSVEEWERVTRKLNLSAKRGHYAVIHPGAAYGTAKRWPASGFSAIARRFVEELGWYVYVAGSPAEFSICDEVLRMSGRAGVVNLAGKTTIREMLALQAGAGFVVANDSGAAHTAAALGVPVIVIFGPTDPERTAPKNPNAVALKGDAPCSPCKHRSCPTDHRCMTSIKTDRVWSEIVGLLENRRKHLT